MGVSQIGVSTIFKRALDSLLSNIDNSSLPLSRPLFHSDCGLLRFNRTWGRWQYEIESIMMKAISEVEGVTEYLTLQMARLGSEAQLALKVSACFGFSINAEVLHAALSGLGIKFVVFLEEVVSSGYLQRLPTTYVWAHDQVHQVNDTVYLFLSQPAFASRFCTLIMHPIHILS